MTLGEIYLNPYFLCYVVAQFVSWGLLTHLHRNTRYFCRNPTESARIFTNVGTYCWLGFFGGYTWFFDSNFVAAFEGNKLYGFYEPARLIAHVLIGSMVFDTVGLIVAKAAPEFYVHHILATGMSMLALMSEPFFCLYFAVYFLGYCELSSIPLVFIDLFKTNKELMDAYPRANTTFRLVFAVLFFVVRLFPWPFVLYDFLSEFFTVLDTFSIITVILVLLAAAFMTFLQFFWGWLLIKNAIKMAKGEKVVIPGEERRGSLTSLTG